MKFWPVKEEFDPDRDKEIRKKYEDQASLTFEERLSLFWRIDSNGTESPELKEIGTVTGVAIMGGFMFGFTSKSMKTMEKFVIDNKHEMFKSPREAQNILRKDMMKHGAIGSLHWGAKMGFFVTSYALSTQTMNVIQNDITGTGHAACGFVLGSLFRVVQGPRYVIM